MDSILIITVDYNRFNKMPMQLLLSGLRLQIPTSSHTIIVPLVSIVQPEIVRKMFIYILQCRHNTNHLAIRYKIELEHILIHLS